MVQRGCTEAVKKQKDDRFFLLLFPETCSPSFFTFIQVADDDLSSDNATIRKRLTSDDPDLTTDERLKIRQFLEAYSDGE